MRRNPWVILGSVVIGQLLVVVDVTILNVGLPVIAKSLQASMVGLEWALAVYSLVMIGLVPTFGRLSDVLGRKRLYLAGLVFFAAGSALAAAASHIDRLIAARVVQAVGGALITANTLAVVTDVFPPGRRGRAMAVQTALISAGAAIGPTIGGFLVTRYGWQWCFLVNLPIAAVGVVYAGLALPPMKPAGKREPIDLLGALLLLVGLCASLLAVTRSGEWGWDDPRTLGSLAGGLAVLVLFVSHERRIAHPIVQMALLRVRAFTAGQLAAMMAMFAMHALTFVIPFYWQGLRGYSAEEAGLFMVPLPVALMAAAPFAGRLADRHGSRGVATFGLALAAVALGLVAAVRPDSAPADVLWRFALLGAGLGFFLPSNNSGVMSAVPSDARGVAAGLLALARFTGQTLGVAVGGTVFVAAAGASLAQRVDPATFMEGMRAVCLTALGLAAVGAFLSFQRGVTRPADAPARPRSASPASRR